MRKLLKQRTALSEHAIVKVLAAFNGALGRYRVQTREQSVNAAYGQNYRDWLSRVRRELLTVAKGFDDGPDSPYADHLGDLDRLFDWGIQDHRTFVSTLSDLAARIEAYLTSYPPRKGRPVDLARRCLNHDVARVLVDHDVPLTKARDGTFHRVLARVYSDGGITAGVDLFRAVRVIVDAHRKLSAGRRLHRLARKA